LFVPAAAYEELEAPAAAAVCLLEVDEAAVGVWRVDEPSPPWTCSLADPGDVEEPSSSGRCSGGSCTSTPWGSEHAEQVAKRVLMAMARLLGFGEGFFLD